MFDFLVSISPHNYVESPLRIENTPVSGVAAGKRAVPRTGRVKIGSFLLVVFVCFYLK